MSKYIFPVRELNNNFYIRSNKQPDPNKIIYEKVEGIRYAFKKWPNLLLFIGKKRGEKNYSCLEMLTGLTLISSDYNSNTLENIISKTENYAGGSENGIINNILRIIKENGVTPRFEMVTNESDRCYHIPPVIDPELIGLPLIEYIRKYDACNTCE
jgi:hypothetical protein